MLPFSKTRGARAGSVNVLYNITHHNVLSGVYITIHILFPDVLLFESAPYSVRYYLLVAYVSGPCCLNLQDKIYVVIFKPETLIDQSLICNSL